MAKTRNILRFTKSTEGAKATPNVNKMGLEIPCCPELRTDNNCDVLLYTKTLYYPYLYKEKKYVVQLIFGFKFTRCTIGTALSDPVFTTSLLPGEKVRLASTDSRSKLFIDKLTNHSYCDDQISEEQYFITAFQTYLHDFENVGTGKIIDEVKKRWNFNGEAEDSLDINLFELKGKVNVSANLNAFSISEFLRKQNFNMRAAATQAVSVTHKSHSISLVEISSRAHSEGTSVREFSNRNACHAVSYYVYRMNKKQTVNIQLTSIDKLVAFPLEPGIPSDYQVLSAQANNDILKLVNKELFDAGIQNNRGELSVDFANQFQFEMEFSLPTPGIIIKGCLDECNTCEPLAIDRGQLENELLRKKIALLEKSQEYRCCPSDCKDEIIHIDTERIQTNKP
jgi:hypothetical protein